MPETTPKQKVERVKMFGGDFIEIILVGDTFDDAQKEAQKQLDNDTVFIHPFDDKEVIEGQGTVALEILDQIDKHFDYLVIPIGGGGLIAGIISVFKELSPKTKIIGVEAQGAPAMSDSLKQNKIIEYLESGKFLFISGSEIGYDLEAQGSDTDKDFYQNYLKADYISDAAGGHQGVYSGYGLSNTMFEGIDNINYDNGSQGTYNVDWPDGIKPTGGASLCAAFTNTDYNTVGGMGIQYEGTFGLSNQTGGIVYLSVGFEAIYPETKRNDLMLRIINKYESQLNVVDELNI